MKIELNSKALEAVSVLCKEDELEANIKLMEDSIGILANDDCVVGSDKEKLDFISAYHRLHTLFKTILENVKE